MNHSTAHFLPFDATNIDDPSVLHIQRKINESPESRTRCLEIIRKKSGNLVGIEPCLDGNFLLRFLRVSKFDTSKALKRLEKYYKQNDVVLDALKDTFLSPQKAQGINHLLLCPYRMKDNSLLLIGQRRGLDYTQINFAQRFYTEIIAFNGLFENPLNQICGFSFILDFEGFQFSDLTVFTPGWVRLFTDTVLSAYPCRTKAVYIVNAPTPFRILYRMVYPFVSKKLHDRVSFHYSNDNWQSLHDLIPVDILPDLYNGKVRTGALINCLENKEELDKKFREIFVYGYSKTKQRRQCMKVLC
ncbi:unnamed protein product [Larinioides sclopetarius]|uniref:CRAL-TRIO domain-containing protein n=1 Tax=Larinioides sclopetarius TaxID=280406 RepID=A0AAV1ZE37_9ARAC